MANRIFRSRLTFRCGGDAAMIVQHWVSNLDPGVDDFAAASGLASQMLLSAMGSQYLPALMFCMSEECFASSLEVTQIWPTGGNAFTYQFQATEETGGVAQPMVTSEISGCLIWLSNEEPAKVGRNFIPGVPSTFVDGGRWQAAALTAYNNFANSCVAGFTWDSNSFDLVIWRAADETFRLVADGYLSPNVAQQSRRGVMP